jgi:hypothetical protein
VVVVHAGEAQDLGEERIEPRRVRRDEDLAGVPGCRDRLRADELVFLRELRETPSISARPASVVLVYQRVRGFVCRALTASIRVLKTGTATCSRWTSAT